jgi:hypothetical protein
MLGISKLDPKAKKKKPWFQCDKKVDLCLFSLPPTKQDFNKSCQKLQRKWHSSWHEQSLFFHHKCCGFSYQKNVGKCGKDSFFPSVNITNFLKKIWGKTLQIMDMTKLGNFKKNHESQIKNWTIFFSLFFPHFSSSSSSILSGSPLID